MNRLFLVAVAAVAILALALAMLIYVPQLSNQSDPVVDLIGGDGRVTRLRVEIADTPGEQARGLMNRTSLAGDAGMLFVFDADRPWSFWMKNTLIPLDMIFIAGDQTIVDIHENAVPLSEEPIVPSGPCRYVLEVNGGLCAAAGVRIGDRVRLDLGP